MIDIIYLAFNRLEFTRESTQAMIANTDWDQVRKLIVYDDGSTDGTREYLKTVQYPVKTELVFNRLGGPVAITNNYLHHKPSEIFCKIDNDVMLPPHWLNESLNVINADKKIDLLGIEAKTQVQDGETQRGFLPSKHIGGIGLMRSRCFRSLPRQYGDHGRMGFTKWQWMNSEIVKGWLNPSVPVFLLDRLPIEPWADLSKKYIKMGWQRKWYRYPMDRSFLWSWWRNND